MDKCVFITGPARSGTNMVAGCFGVSGVWFGPLRKIPGLNPKGLWESAFFQQAERPAGDFGQFMLRHGYQGGPWGLKEGPSKFSYVAHFDPVVVLVWRPLEDILDSRKRHRWSARPNVVTGAWAEMEQIRERAECYDVHSRLVADGDYSELLPVFDRIGAEMNIERISEWVERGLLGRKEE